MEIVKKNAYTQQHTHYSTIERAAQRNNCTVEEIRKAINNKLEYLSCKWFEE